MKTWMKILFWGGLGTAFGFFIGYNVGQRQKPDEDALDEAWYQGWEAAYYEGEKADKALEEYSGETPAENEEEDVEMPGELPPIDEEDGDIPVTPKIRQLHPQDMTPEIITEQEVDKLLRDPENTYDQINLLYYQGDDVLYNATESNIETDPDGLVGPGTVMAFGGDPNNPVETLWVKSPTWGKIFRIDAVDDCFGEAVDGTAHPDDDDLDEN